MASLRDEMPQVAAWIDDIRATFCQTPEDLASFNAQIRAGMSGQPTFYARENGREVGTLDPRQGVVPSVTWSEAQAAEKRAAEKAGKGRK